LQVVSNDHTIEALLNTFNESLTHIVLYCDCEELDGYFHYYATLNVNELPVISFNKTDFINHIETTSTPSSNDLVFLNNSIVEVYLAFPSVPTGSLRKTVLVISEYDLMVPYLYGFSESFDLVEIICGQPVLSVNDQLDISNSITIIPNPVVSNSIISIDDQLFIEQLSIFDITGKLILKKENLGSNTISTNEFNLAPGLYVLKFTSENAYIIKKIIVK
jgi:hypothetical protein